MDVVLREMAREHDLQAVRAVFNAMDVAEVGEIAVRDHDVDAWVRAADVGAWVALAGEQIVGFASLRRLSFRPQWLRADLASPEQAVIAALLDHLRDQAQASGATALTLWQISGGLAEGALHERGWRALRTFVWMKLALPREPAYTAPAQTVGIALRSAREEASQRLAHQLIEEALVEHWDYHPHSFEEFVAMESGGSEPALWYLADVEGEPAGALVVERHEDYALIAWLGVSPRRRRRGVAAALLEQSFAELERGGTPRVEVSVDRQNATGATRVYERMGMRPWLCVQQWRLQLGERVRAAA